MGRCFFDSSALAELYQPEAGSDRVTTQIGRVPVTTDGAIPLSTRRTRMLTAACRKPTVAAESNLGRSVEELFDSSPGNPRTVPGLFLGGGFGALLGVAGRGDETAAGGPRSMARSSGASDPALPGVLAGLMSRRWGQETD